MAIQLIKRKKGVTYRATVWKNRVRVTHCFARKVDAERWEREQKAGISPFLATTPVEKVTLSELRKRFESEYGMSRQAPSTVKLERGIFEKHLASHLGWKLIGEISSDDLHNVFHTLLHAHLVSPGRVNRVRTLLNGMFNWAVRKKMAIANPVCDVAPFPTDSGALEKNYCFLTQEEARRLLDWLAVNESWLYSKVRVLLNCGIRYGEMAALRVQDLASTPSGAILRISRTHCRHTLEIRNRTKGRRSRVIPLSPSMAAFLCESVKGKRGDAPLLWENWEEADNPWKFGKLLRKAFENAEVTPIRVHDLRHTFAVHFLERGGHLYDLQQILGHSTSKLTERYSHFSLAMVQRSCGIVDHHGQGKPDLTVIDGGVPVTMTHKRHTKVPEAALAASDASR